MNTSAYSIFFVLLMILAVALLLGNSDAISAAITHAAPGRWLAEKILSSLFSIVLSGIVLGIAGVVTTQLHKWWRTHQYQQRHWKSGPNAYWQQSQPKAAKPISTEKMMQMALLQRLLPPTQSQNQPPMILQQPQDDEPELYF